MEEKKSIQELLDEFHNSEAFKQQAQFVEERNKTVKKGDNVVHLQYFGGIAEADLKAMDQQLESVGLVFSRRDETGILKASLDDFTLVSFIALSQPIVIEILKGILPNATWDVIKSTLIFVWGKFKGKTFKKATSNGLEEKPMSFGLHVRLDDKTEFNFELNGDFDQETIEKALEQVEGFLQAQKPKTEYGLPNYVYFSTKKGHWIEVDVMEAIRKKAKKQASKRKKK